MPSLAEYIMNVGGGMDLAKFGLEERTILAEQEQGRQGLMQGLLQQIVGMQQNPMNVVAALQAQRAGGVGGAVAAGGGKRTTPFGDIAQQLIQNMAAYSGAYQDPTTGISQNPLQLERQRMIDQGLDPDTGAPLSAEKKAYYDNIAQFLGGQNLDENFSAERFQNLIGGGIGGGEARRQAGLSDEDFNAIWGPILRGAAGGKRSTTGGGSFQDPVGGGVIGPYQFPTGTPPRGIPSRPPLSSLTPGLIRRGRV